MTEAIASMIRLMRQRGQFYPMYVDLPEARIFTMFFPSKQKNASVLIYNPGGPGGSGIGHMFNSYGPLIYIYDENGDIQIVENQGSEDLTSRFHLLYLDIPANTGFSIAKKENLQYGDKLTVENALRAIKAVLKYQRKYVGDNPTLDFFGFSYAGKVWPLVARRMLQDGYKVGGLALFSGYTHPILQEIRPIMEYLLYAGLITSDDYARLEKMTDHIENMIRQDPTGKNWKHIQDIYIDTVTAAWEAASVDTYDIKEPSIVEDPLDKPVTISDITHPHKDDEDEEEEDDTSVILNDPSVLQALGISGPFFHSATTFDIDRYEGFLAPATDALKFLADKGVLILYVMGSLDGATLAKGTKDMLELLFKRKIHERRWVIDVADLVGIDINGPFALIGKIAQITPNVYYGTVIGSGHSLDSPQGILAFGNIMEYLYQKKGPVLT